METGYGGAWHVLCSFMNPSRDVKEVDYEGRMPAVPLVRTCIDCAEKLERRRQTRVPREFGQENKRVFAGDLTLLSDES